MKSSRIGDMVRSGDYLGRARVRRIAVIYLLVTIISFGILLATSDGFKDRLGRPLGTDFMAFHVAGTIALEDGGGAAYDAQKQYAAHQTILGEEAPPYWPFLYPPAFLFVAMALASLPYLAGWFAWMATTLGAYVAAMQKIAPGKLAALVALAFPAVYENFLHGQNGFILAALFATGLNFLFAGRGVLAGIAFGLIAIKPQYGALIPVALIAAGQWRAFAAAAVTVVTLAALPTIAFGPEVWGAFFETMRAARVEVVEAGAIGFEKIQSAFSQARMLGAPVSLAYGVQALVLIAVAYFVFDLWRGKAAGDIKAAGLIIGSLLVSPYTVDYDLVILAPAIAFLVRDGIARGFGPYEKTIMLFAAFAPVIARPVGSTAHLSMGLAALLALFWIVLRRAR